MFWARIPCNYGTSAGNKLAAEYVARLHAREETVLEVLQMSVKMDELAERLYADFASACADPALKELFARLS